MTSLLCRVRRLRCALPLIEVEETMRPLPVERISGVPAFVSGLSIVRGAPIPVIDAASLLTGESGSPTRYITLKTGGGRVALGVDAIEGLADIQPETFGTMPSLLQQAHPDVIRAVGTLDAGLLIVLQAARLVPDEAWSQIEAARHQ